MSVLERLRRLHARGTVLASVARARSSSPRQGCSTGVPRPPWGAAIDAPGGARSGIEPRPDDRFVDTGDIVTAAGVSAGIDMALHLVARLHSVERAREVRRYIQYDPAPPVGRIRRAARSDLPGAVAEDRHLGARRA